MLLYSTNCLKRNSKMKNKEQHTFPFIERLLDGVEVEWKPLGEVSCVLRGKRLTKKELNNEEIYPVFHGGIEPIGYYHEANRDAGSTMIINVGASAGTISFSPKRFWSSDGCFCFSHVPALNQKYLFYYLQSIEPSIRAKVRKAGIPTLDNKLVEKLLIPIPPIAVQEEIVDILDKFTELEAELEAELEGRKRQYEYYRNQLLSFELLNEGDEKSNSIRWLTIGEISKNISSGGTPRSSVSSYYGGNIPWLRTQEVNFSEIWDTEIKITEEGLESSSAKYIPANCIIVAMYGATVGRVGINKIPLTTNQACANIEVNEEIALYRYVFHCLSDLYQYIKSLGKGSQTNINVKVVRNIQIPIPPLSEQQRIVSILDKFDTLTASISEGLPKEIELRRKQYEYYRDRLLSFKH